MRKPRKRPVGWGQDLVIRGLEDGLTLKELTARAADGAPCKAPTLMRDIEQWRARDERFAMHVEDLLEQQTGTLKVEGKRGRTKLTPELKEQFLIALEEHGGDVQKTCEAVGVAFSTVYGHIKPNSALHDPLFADRFITLEAQRFNLAREEYWKIALDEQNVPVQVREKALWNLLKTGLPSLHSEKQQLEITGNVSHTHAVIPLAAVEDARRFAAGRLAEVAQAERRRLSADVVEAEIVQ